MINAIIGKKIEQTQRFLENGVRIPVTLIVVPDAPVIAVKTTDKEGYTAVQIGYGAKKKATRAEVGHAKKAQLEHAPRVLREVQLAGDAAPVAGDIIKVEDVLQPGDIVSVTGTSKGKGFAGVVKRHNFRGGPRTHGQSDRERAPGSIGQTTTPGRVYRGKRMAGRMGQDTVTLTNLVVVDITTVGGVKTVFVKGLVPGGVNSIVTIAKTGQVKNFVPVQKPAIVETAPVAPSSAAEEQTAGEEAVKGEQGA